MDIYRRHVIPENSIAREALRILDQLPDSVTRTLFIVRQDNSIVGTLTDGDIRRGLLNGLEISHPVSAFMNRNYKFIRTQGDHVEIIKGIRNADIHLVPVVDDDNRITRILDLTKVRTILPAAALLMAGGRGERLRPFTDTVPKPMLKVGGKPILEHNVDRLISYGISEIYISVKYLKEQIMDFFGDGSEKGVSIRYIIEDEPLGTLGSISHIDSIPYDDILVMNSDLVTNIDFEDFYNYYRDSESLMAVASIPYHVNVPYAVLQTDEKKVSSFVEKPTYTYYSNGGIYLMKFQLKSVCSKNTFFNATDLMDRIIADGGNLVHYPVLGYWLDIGRPHDYLKAQDDVKHINLS